jgi:hypothetical protein
MVDGANVGHLACVSTLRRYRGTGNEFVRRAISSKPQLTGAKVRLTERAANTSGTVSRHRKMPRLRAFE